MPIHHKKGMKFMSFGVTAMYVGGMLFLSRKLYKTIKEHIELEKTIKKSKLLDKVLFDPTTTMDNLAERWQEVIDNHPKIFGETPITEPVKEEMIFIPTPVINIRKCKNEVLEV
jgi:hypothetical protein